MNKQITYSILALSLMVLAGCGSMATQTQTPNAAERSQQIAEEMAAASAMMESPASPAERAINQVVKLSQRSLEKSEAAITAGNAGDMHGYLVLKTEAMLAQRQAAQALETSQNFSSETSSSAQMAAQAAFDAAQQSWDQLMRWDQEML